MDVEYPVAEMSDDVALTTAENTAVAGATGRSLIGDYVTLVVCVHVVFCAACWLVQTGFSSGSGLVVATAGWVIARLCLRDRPAIAAVPVTALLLGAVSMTQVVASASIPVFFSSPVLAGLLVLLLLMDARTIFERLVTADAQHREMVRQALFRYGPRGVLYGIALILAVNALAIPLFEEWQFRSTPAPTSPLGLRDRLTLEQNIMFRLFQGLSALFFFTIGACVGSFLNVVIYRLPLRVSVLVKPSYCPGCEELIEGSDNIPLIGWLRLKAQCRNCSIEISSRYPSVELLIGSCFLILYFVELISGGQNLPERTPNAYNGVLWVLFYTKWDLVGLYLYHCFVLCTLFSWAMIRRDGNRVPAVSILIILFLVVLAPVVIPLLHPLPATTALSGTSAILKTLATSGAGILAGFGSVSVLWVLCRTSASRNLPHDPASWVLMGAALGWQAVICVLAFLVVWALLEGLLNEMSGVIPTSEANQKINWLALPAVAFVSHCVWRPVVHFFLEA